MTDIKATWYKVNLRSADKKLPQVGQKVMWGYFDNDGRFYTFLGYLNDYRKIDTGFSLYKLTSHYYWIDVPSPVNEE